MSLLQHIDIVPNFPKEGINFYDVQSLLKKPDIWQNLISDLVKAVTDQNVDLIVGIESRGFLTGVPVAQELGLPFGMVRKKGKLPGEVIGQSYELEYGTDTVEIQKGLISAGTRVAIMDDLLATGGTMQATGELIRKAGGEVALSTCIIELHELDGRAKLDFDFMALLQAPLDPFSSAA